MESAIHSACTAWKPNIIRSFLSRRSNSTPPTSQKNNPTSVHMSRIFTYTARSRSLRLISHITSTSPLPARIASTSNSNCGRSFFACRDADRSLSVNEPASRQPYRSTSARFSLP